MLQKIQETADYIKNKVQRQPDFVIILGSGLSKLQNEVQLDVEIPYTEIPHFPLTTVVGHTGKLLFGTIENTKVLMMSGRFHYYEGYSMQEVTFPIRVFNLLGIKKLIVSNASGGVNPSFKIGDILIIKDHINLFPEHPLHGKNLDSFGPRFPDMSQAYDKKFIDLIFTIAREKNILLQEGVYMGLQGPTFETPSEYEMIKILGADAVGMSTVPEIIVAHHQGMRCLAISVITDIGGKEIKVPISHEEVLQVANNTMHKIIILIKEFLKKEKNKNV